MRYNTCIWVVCLLAIAFLGISCTGTSVTQTHFDDAYEAKPVSNILIIAVTGNEHNRRVFERKFVAHLKSLGVAAIASETALPMPPDLKLTKEPIIKVVDQFRNDAVIITQLIGKKKEEMQTRSGEEDPTYFSYTLDPGYSTTIQKVRLETNLYDAQTGTLIWSGQTETLSKASVDQIMNDVIKAVVTELQKNKLITSKDL